VSGNTADNNTNEDIEVFNSCNYNNVSGNMANNSYVGINIYNSSHNAVTGNTADNNTEGIYLDYSSGNVVWLNVFRGNVENAYCDETPNSWNSSSKTSYMYDGVTYTNYTGNYWGDYSGNSINGIGVTPYIISANDIDYYPMVLTLPPVAGFTSNVTSGWASLTVQFNDTSSNQPNSWNWSFGDGNYSFVQDPVHTYAVTGLYNVSLKASNSAGSDMTIETGYINVSANPSPSPSPSPTVTPTPTPSATPSPSPSPIPGSFTLNLNDGWNLVSLPIENSSLWAGNISANSVDKVAYYNGSTQLFSTFLVGLSHANKNFPVVPDMGYFVNCTSVMDLTVYGTLVDSPRSLTLYPGWNMVGWSSSSNMTAMDFGGLSGNISKIARYNSQTELYTTYLVGLSHADRDFNMTRGNGYFVYSNATSIVSVNI